MIPIPLCSFSSCSVSRERSSSARGSNIRSCFTRLSEESWARGGLKGTCCISVAHRRKTTDQICAAWAEVFGGWDMQPYVSVKMSLILSSHLRLWNVWPLLKLVSELWPERAASRWLLSGKDLFGGFFLLLVSGRVLDGALRTDVPAWSRSRAREPLTPDQIRCTEGGNERLNEFSFYFQRNS